ncbi:hypothetical protein ACLKA6_019046 [Drosophila palustris]
MLKVSEINQFIRAGQEKLTNEQERQRNDIVAVKSDMQLYLTVIELQKKFIVDKEVDNRVLRADLKRLENSVEELAKFVDGLLKDLDKHHNCTEAKFSGIHDILVPKFSIQSFKAVCDAETWGGGWTIILRRIDGSVNFTRNWAEYKNGFGNLDGEYFLGLDKIHAMTAARRQELLVLFEDFEGDHRFETYDEFAIGNEDQLYNLHTLGKANGTAGDSLWYHRGKTFSTFDNSSDKGFCAIHGTGAWWYGDCMTSQLTGTYKDNRLDKGVFWNTFRGHRYSLKTAIMMIRPK